jgi:uncharacterized spore protein YtfJ
MMMRSDMSEVEELLKATIGEMERLLASKTVIARADHRRRKDCNTPLERRRGFGAGAARGRRTKERGGGAGGGFGIKPVADYQSSRRSRSGSSP